MKKMERDQVNFQGTIIKVEDHKVQRFTKREWIFFSLVAWKTFDLIDFSYCTEYFEFWKN